MEDVVLPELEPAFNVDDEKSLDVVTAEQEQLIVERLVSKEVKDKKFPLIRQELQGLVDKYDSVTSLVGIPAAELPSQVVGRAFVVSEITQLLSAFDQIIEADDGEQS